MGLLGLGAILIAIILPKCSDEHSPTPPARTVPGLTITAQPGITLVPTPLPTTTLTDREAMEEIPVGGSVDGRLDEPGEIDRFLFQADEGVANQIKAVWDTLPSIRVDIYDAYIRDGFPTFGKVKEASREPFRLVWTAPESGKYNLDVS